MDRNYVQLSSIGVERSELIEDLVRGLSPNKRFGMVVVVFEEIIDSLGQLLHASKDTATNALVGYLAEEPLDEVEPRRRGGDEMHVEMWMTGQPLLDVLVLVR